MYKKIKTSGSFTPFKGECSKELCMDTPAETLSLLALFREDLRKEKLQDLTLLTLPIEILDALVANGRVTSELPTHSCRESCFYKTETSQILFVEKIISKSPSIDLVEIKHIGGDFNG
jgi:hypothetical protein